MHRGVIDLDHKMVETVREWNPVKVVESDKIARRKILTNLMPDEWKMFNEDVYDDLQYKEFTLEGDPTGEDIDRSACTISNTLVAATDRIIRQRAANNKKQPH
jgi:hypothetical protein